MGGRVAIEALKWDGEVLWLIDQRRLPLEETWLKLGSYEEIGTAIGDLVVRGAPAIGVSAAFAMVLAARSDASTEGLQRAAGQLRQVRPTAVNLAWAIDRVSQRILQLPQEERVAAAEVEAEAIRNEDRAACAAMARHGADLFEPGSRVQILTHCNAGALATAGIGTAVGVVRELHARGCLERLWAGETRPILQGARLTAWEAMQDGLPVTLMADTASGKLFSTDCLDAVVVGADRIAADGGVANKVGTYNLAVLADRHNVPMYVAAPTSTVDLNLSRGSSIPIEQRSADEVTEIGGQRIAPLGVEVFNPAFDITPAELISAIITENGVARPPFEESLRSLCRKA
ncbi:MAG: S-methyl-5-thioribose-1-phosphate isomerase [bacterium]|nr:S-methyl-5-thioribose-1-phosphate isomerase [bacterium]